MNTSNKPKDSRRDFTRPFCSDERIRCTVDILSGSSCCMGNGTVLVSVVRASAYATKRVKKSATPGDYADGQEQEKHGDNCQQKLDIAYDPSSTILSRYLFGDCCENLCRICQDQKQALGPKLVGVFLTRDQNRAAHTSSSLFASTVGVMDGLPSLVYFLSSAGSGSLKIACASSDSRHVELVRHEVLGVKRMYPNVQICEIPEPDSTADFKNSNMGEKMPDSKKRRKSAFAPSFSDRPQIPPAPIWWNVHEDAHIRIQATTQYEHSGVQGSGHTTDEKKCGNPINLLSSASPDNDSQPRMVNRLLANSISSNEMVIPLNIAYIVTVKGQEGHQQSFLFAPDGMFICEDSLPVECRSPARVLNDKSRTGKFLKFVLRLRNSFSAFNKKSYEVSIHDDIALGHFCFQLGSRNVDDEVEKILDLDNISWDKGLLHNSLRQSSLLHDVLPFVFPSSRGTTSPQSKFFSEQQNESSLSDDNQLVFRVDSDRCQNVTRQLCTGDSLAFSITDPPYRIPRCTAFPYRSACQKIDLYASALLQGKVKDENSATDKKTSIAHPIPKSLKALDVLRAAYVSPDEPLSQTHSNKPIERDEDEIQLSDDEEGEEVALHQNGDANVGGSPSPTSGVPIYDTYRSQIPYMLVLGTGCAAPSVTKGSSGYAIFMPSQNSPSFVSNLTVTGSVSWENPSLFALLDCGEGCLSALIQHLPKGLSLSSSLVSLKMIWISHAHLDHYGGLSSIVRLCHIERQKHSMFYSAVLVDPILVIAPKKCLRYLDSALGSQNGVKKEVQLFHGMTHSDLDHQILDFGKNCSRRTSNLVITRALGMHVSIIKNIRVEHCPDANALILGLKWKAKKHAYNAAPSNEKYFTIVYSGDCRPSRRLVSECLNVVNSPMIPNRGINFLIHEATFADDMKDDAVSKKHSTFSEALQVAIDIGAESCMLTHFSQRYRSSSNTYNFKTRHKFLIQEKSSDKRYQRESDIPFFSALDGMWLPLSQRLTSSGAMSNLDIATAALLLTVNNKEVHETK